MFQNYQFDPKSPTKRHTFEIHNCDISIVNAIRRIILTDIPVVGFLGEDKPSFEVIKNTGALHNEFILHRLGLLPIHLTEEETEAYPADTLTFELQAQGGSSTDSNTLFPVTTHQFTIMKNDVPLSVQEVHRLFPVHPISKSPILITRLRQGEELHVRGSPMKSTARQHAGFCPVSLCTFSYMMDEVKAAKVESVLDKERAFKKNKYGDPTAVQFEIEPECGLSPKYLVSKALELILEKLDTVQHEIYNEESQSVSIKTGDNKGYDFTFQKEDDTLGNLLQSYIHVNFVRTKAQTANGEIVKYVGYYCPHPLDSTMVLNITFEDETTARSNYLEFLSSCARQLSAQIQEMLTAWLRFVPK